jgi:hypothetical protein
VLNCPRRDGARIVIASPGLFTYRVDNARNVARWLREPLKKEALLAARLPQGAEIE